MSANHLEENATFCRVFAACSDFATGMMRRSHAAALRPGRQRRPKRWMRRALRTDLLAVPLAVRHLRSSSFDRRRNRRFDSSIREMAVRCVVCLMLLLSGLMCCAARIDVEGSSVGPARIAGSSWRRTKDGWQRSDRWLLGANSTSADALIPEGHLSLGRLSLPHPLIVALLLLLPSLFFLLAFAPVSTADLSVATRHAAGA